MLEIFNDPLAVERIDEKSDELRIARTGLIRDTLYIVVYAPTSRIPAQASSLDASSQSAKRSRRK